MSSLGAPKGKAANLFAKLVHERLGDKVLEAMRLAFMCTSNEIAVLSASGD